MENELAVMAIKGGRYSEAEQMFNNEITSKPTPMSYYGLGLCKLNMILDVGRTTEEAFYCFEKAVSLSEEKERSKVERDIIAICVGNLEQLQNLHTQLEKEKKQQANAALIGAALTVGSAMIGSSHKSNAFTQISSLAVAGAGVGISLEGLSNLGTIPEIQSKISALAADIKSRLKSVINLEIELLDNSLNSLPDISLKIKEIEDSNKWYNKNYGLLDPRRGLADMVKMLVWIGKKLGLSK